MKFSPSHTWAILDGECATIGLSDFAQKELGDVVYVELPQVGQKVKAEEIACVLESTKAATDIYSPLTGTVIEVNSALTTTPEMINTASEKQGWLFKLRVESAQEYNQLLTPEEYLKGKVHDAGCCQH